MNTLPDFIDSLGLAGPWTYAALFVAVSLLMTWRLEAMLDRGLEGTALGTLVMPYCSGLGNLLFVFIVARRGGPAGDVLTNCVVNNFTNLTLVLGLPALVWGLNLSPDKPAPAGRAKKPKKKPKAETARRLNRLSLLLTLAAALFFCGMTWALGRDGRLDLGDGLALTGLFLFWQCFQVFDVLKHNITHRKSFGPLFWFDALIVLAAACVMYVSIDWLVTWVSGLHGGFVNAQHLGWLSGWLMVLPNALFAVYYGVKRRTDIVYASQIGDGHICIPLCLGLAALLQPVAVTPVFVTGLAVLTGTALLHLVFVAATGGLPRWLGGMLVATYGWFLYAGLLQ